MLGRLSGGKPRLSGTYAGPSTGPIWVGIPLSHTGSTSHAIWSALQELPPEPCLHSCELLHSSALAIPIKMTYGTAGV